MPPLPLTYHMIHKQTIIFTTHKEKNTMNLTLSRSSAAPVNPDKNVPVKPNVNPDPTKPKPGGNEPKKNDPTRIEEPGKADPTRIDEQDPSRQPKPEKTKSIIVYLN